MSTSGFAFALGGYTLLTTGTYFSITDIYIHILLHNRYIQIYTSQQQIYTDIHFSTTDMYRYTLLNNRYVQTHTSQ